MEKRKSTTLLLVVFGFLSTALYAQDYGPKLGPYAKKNKFTHNDESTRQLKGHRHVPKLDGVKAYNKEGEAVTLKRTDSVTVDYVYDGSWNNRKGKWVLFHSYGMIEGTTSTQAYYVWLNDLKDVEAESKVADKAIEAVANRSLDAFRNTFFKNVLPAVLLLFSTIYFLRKFFIKVSELFAKLSGHAVSGCLGLLVLSPIALAVYDVLSTGRSSEGNAMMNVVYRIFNINPLLHTTVDFSTLSFWEAFYFQAMMTFITIAVILVIWIGMGFILSGITVLLTSGSPATAHGTSTDGGKTIYVHSITPGSPATDVDLGAVVKLWLIYSIVFPLMYILAENLWGNENLFASIFIALLLTAIVTFIYQFLIKKNKRVDALISKFALSFLGFAVCIVTIFIIFILLKLLFDKLS